MMTCCQDALVPEDGPGVDSRGGLYQVPDPGVARPGVGDQGPGLQAVPDTEPGHELVTGGVSRPELVMGTTGVPGDTDHHFGVISVFDVSFVITFYVHRVIYTA